MDRVGQNDPYVTVAVGGEPTQRTSTIDGGGPNPRWGKDGMGEVLQFFTASPGIPPVTLTCWDDDGGLSAHDLIGSVCFVGRGRPFDQPFSTRESKVLRNEAGANVGT